MHLQGPAAADLSVGAGQRRHRHGAALPQAPGRDLRHQDRADRGRPDLAIRAGGRHRRHARAACSSAPTARSSATGSATAIRAIDARPAPGGPTCRGSVRHRPGAAVLLPARSSGPARCAACRCSRRRGDAQAAGRLHRRRAQGGDQRCLPVRLREAGDAEVDDDGNPIVTRAGRRGPTTPAS
jgi:hypothetical protein